MARDKLKVRRGQVITTYGIGSIITSVDNESLLLLSAGSWDYNKNIKKYMLSEPRLESFLKGRKLILPPESNETRIHGMFIPSDVNLTAIRFPSWHYCFRCHEMLDIGLLANKPTCRNEKCGSKGKSNTLVPVRFLVVCKNGHIDDFPFREWVHDGKSEKGHVLSYNPDRNLATTAGIWINCKTCDKKKPLRNALLPGKLNKIYKCMGYRHWLFEEDLSKTIEECNEEVQGIQKGSSNLYFPIIKNSIWIPSEKQFPQDVENFVQQFPLKQIYNDNTLEKFKEYVTVLINADNYEISFQDVLAYLTYEPETDNYYDYEALKYKEYKAFVSVPGRDDDLDYRGRIQDCSNYEDWVSKYVGSVTLLEKIRDTRAFCGFTRLKSADQLDVELEKSMINITGPDSNLLPATFSRGEGIFIKLNENRIEEWLKNKKLNEHIGQVQENMRPDMQALESYPTFILLHTLSHLLIKEMSLECGYSSPSLRERIYCNSYKRDKMNGILIYTSAGDTEGSLGGLVNMGKPGNLERIIKNALEKSHWCSSDPICSSIGAQGPFSNNLASCHNCSIISETSCEHFNSHLDRTLLVNTYINKSINYFDEV